MLCHYFESAPVPHPILPICEQMTDEDVEDLAKECGIPKLPLRRFKKALAELGAKVTVD